MSKSTAPESDRELVICADLEDLSRYAAKTFASLATEAVRERGRFTVCLSGGSTPRRTYALLAEEPFHSSVPWEHVHIFWGDERVVPLDQPDNHFRMTTDILFSKVALPANNIHRMRVESGSPAQAAADYEALLKSFFALVPGELPTFDLIILGMGADAHMASLFPGTTALDESQRLVAANYVPKLQADRLTLTLPVLNHARRVMFLVSGASKAAAFEEVQSHSRRIELPASLLQPIAGKTYWVVDRDAASKFQGSMTTLSEAIAK
jgi:6-phosphogluconolactonase